GGADPAARRPGAARRRLGRRAADAAGEVRRGRGDRGPVVRVREWSLAVRPCSKCLPGPKRRAERPNLFCLVFEQRAVSDFLGSEPSVESQVNKLSYVTVSSGRVRSRVFRTKQDTLC